MFKPKLPPCKKVLFSAKSYSATFLNSLFKKLQERPEPFLGALAAEYDQGLLFLFINDQRVRTRLLASGDMIQLGNTTLRVIIEP